MVQVFEGLHIFNYDFPTVSFAYLNRYPNPFAKHVLSIDTLDYNVDELGRLSTTRLIVKTGRLPSFIKPFLGSSLNSWIIEKTLIDPKTNQMRTYTSNIDHRKFIRVEEYLNYSAISPTSTQVQMKVKFSSNFIGFKQKIEEWSHKRFSTNLANSREGLKYVISQLNDKKKLWMKSNV